MITLNTIALKEALSKVNKCASNDKAAPLTQLVSIKTVNPQTLEFTSSDERNIFTYKLIDETANFEDVNFCVLVDQLSKLVTRFSSANTNLLVNSEGLELKLQADGEYTVAIPVDSDGLPIKFPEFNYSDPVTEIYSGPISSILAATKYCEGSLTKLTLDIQTEDYPRTNYYVGNEVVALDGFLATAVYGEFLPFAALWAPSTAKILTNFEDEGFKYYKTKVYNVFESTTCRMLTIEPEGLEAFPVEVALNMIEATDGYSVSIVASHFVNALDRLKLFTSEITENAVKLTFNSTGVFVSTVENTCIEPLSAEPQNEFECYVNAVSLMAQLKPFGPELITLKYGNDVCIKTEFNNISQIAVLTDLSGEE